MSPSQIGERAEAAVLHALVLAGKTVSLPIGGSCRYDLIYEDDTGLYRLQCKTGRVLENVITFRTCSQTGKVSKHYRGEVDAFGVYCHSRDEVYLVPIDGMPSTAMQLRLEPTRSGQQRGVWWAKD